MPALRSVIVILGPTASGKSSLGVRLAKRFKGVVISADSRQVYRGLRIGSGQIPPLEMRGVPHFLLGVASPRTQYSVARYVRNVQRVLKTLPVSKPVFLVGGSPFYIDALTKPGSFSTIPPNPALRRRLAEKTTSQLVAWLKKHASERAATIDIANRRRLIRAVEVTSNRHQPTPPVIPAMRVLKIGLRQPRPKLFARIDRQITRRLRQGMIAETQRLHRQGASWARLESLGLEYRVLVHYLRGHLNRAEAERRMKTVTHDFARRQMTWWKRERDIHWITSPARAAGLVSRFLG